MNRFSFAKLGRTLLMLTAVLAVGLLGCGGDDNPNNGGGGTDTTGGNNNGGGSVPIEKWMKKNLDVLVDSSWCYDGDPANCDKYGRLYTWEAAKAACQLAGKRLPTDQEWWSLVNAAGGKNDAGGKLKARHGWNDDGNGTDNYGFSALPGGHRSYYEDSFDRAGDIGYWWTAKENGYNAAVSFMMTYNTTEAKLGVDNAGYGYSVRCVEN